MPGAVSYCFLHGKCRCCFTVSHLKNWTLGEVALTIVVCVQLKKKIIGNNGVYIGTLRSIRCMSAHQQTGSLLSCSEVNGFI